MATGPAPHLPATHARVTMALIAAENAIDLLKRRHVLQGRFYLSQVVSNLKHASEYLKEGGQQYDNRRAFIDMLQAWYQAELSRVRGPATTPQIAAEVYAQQGLLATSDPYLTVS